MKPVKRVSRLLLAPVLILAAASGCDHGRRTAVSVAGAPIKVPVTVVQPEPSRDEIVLPGRVEAREEVTVSSRLAGRVTALPFPDGGSFREGETLARFDAPEEREELAAAEATWRAASAARELARKQEARFESLYASKVAALHELELARAERERVEAAERGAAAAAAGLRAGVEIRAPFAGVIIRRRVDPGAEVGQGTPLLDIRSHESGLVAVAIPERWDAMLAGPAAIQTADGPWRAAKLARADGMIDPLSRTRTARFRPVGGGGLEPGAFARVRVGIRGDATPLAGASGEWTIPDRALVTRGALAGVYVLRQGRVSLRWLRLGRRVGANVAVLAGLDPGDSLALDPTGLEDGIRAEASR